MKVYIEKGCLQQLPANHCLSLFYLSLSSLYHIISISSATIVAAQYLRRFHLNRSTAVPGARQMEDGKIRLPPATLRLYGN